MLWLPSRALRSVLPRDVEAYFLSHIIATVSEQDQMMDVQTRRQNVKAAQIIT